MLQQKIPNFQKFHMITEYLCIATVKENSVKMVIREFKKYENVLTNIIYIYYYIKVL